MEELFPLQFKRRKEDFLSRGLSSREAKSRPDLSNHFFDPRRIPSRKSYYCLTVAFDLDQTLVSAEGIEDEDENDPLTKLVIRPHAAEALKALRRHEGVEFIVWTAGIKEHAKRVVYSFPEMHFDYVISRDPSWYDEDTPTKNLNLLASSSRPLSTVILVDDRMDIGIEHPENLLIVPAYEPKETTHVSTDATMLYLANIIHRAIKEYKKNPSNSFCSYLFSPLTEKCKYEDLYYYGVKCFSSKGELEDRIRKFRLIPGNY